MNRTKLLKFWKGLRPYVRKCVICNGLLALTGFADLLAMAFPVLKIPAIALRIFQLAYTFRLCWYVMGLMKKQVRYVDLDLKLGKLHRSLESLEGAIAQELPLALLFDLNHPDTAKQLAGRTSYYLKEVRDRASDCRKELKTVRPRP